MYPWLRLFYHMQKAKRAPSLSLQETCVVPMRVSLLFDSDIFLEMNNGRHLTLYDIGRFVFAQRTGLWEQVKARGWAFVVAGLSVRYRKRLHPWQTFEQHTRLLGHDEKWVYFLQTHQRGEVWHSAAVIRAAVVNQGKLVPTQAVLEIMQAQEWQPELPAWVKAWIASEDQRDWPQ